MKILKRIAALVVALIIVVTLLPDVTPKASAAVGTGFEWMTAADISWLSEVCNSYAKVGALETMLGSGLVPAEAVAGAEAIIANHAAKAAASGMSAASLSTMATALATAGFVVVATDWGSYWDMIFDNDKYLANYRETNNFLSGWIANNSHVDEWATSWINATGIPESLGHAAWDWDYVEVTNSGWNSIYDWAKGLFGTNSGVQMLPEVGWQQMLSMANATYYCTVDEGTPYGKVDYYTFPSGTYFYDNVFGQQAYDTLGGSGWVIVYTAYFDSNYLVRGYNKTTSSANFPYVVVGITENEFNSYASIARGIKLGAKVGAGYWYNGKLLGGSSEMFTTTRGALGLPEIPYENNIPSFDGKVPDDDGKTVFYMPPVTTNPDMTDTQKFYELAEGLRTTGVTVGTGDGNDPDKPTDPDKPKEDDDKEDEDTSIKWDLLTDGWSGFTGVFPFSLPWDMVNIFGSLRAERETPHIEVRLPEALFNSDFVLDLSQLEGVAALVRGLVLGLWVLGLVMVTRKLTTW